MASFAKGVSAKDVILALIKKLVLAAEWGYVIEYTGETIRAMSMKSA
jgi:homoaconitase/3-isopropylmalate dehydratase large subunit